MAAFEINKLVDSAGAGDWCSAGIIDKICRDGINGFLKKEESEIVKALNYGQILGSINCLFDGALGALYN